MTPTERLTGALEAGRPSQLPPATLRIEEIDISGWDEFGVLGGGSFFDKPMCKSTFFQSGVPLSMVLDCSYFSVISSDKQTAITKLRRDLLFIKNLWPKVKVVAFLSKPALLEIVTDPKPNEMADTSFTTDLSGPKPGKRKWAAFCFLFAYEDGFQHGNSFNYKQLTPKRWKELGLPSATEEGQLGPEVASNQMFMAVSPEKAPARRDTTWAGVQVESEALPLLDDEAVEIDVSDLESAPLKEYLDQPYHGHKLDSLTAQGVTDPARVTGYVDLPEVKAAAKKHGIDLSAPPGRELQEMRKYFGSGTGLYLATVDFQLARVSAAPLSEEAQKAILKALDSLAKPKRKRKPAKKAKTKRLTRRRKSR